MAGKASADLGVYSSILLWIFRTKTPDPTTGDLLFTQTDLREAANQLHLEVRNFPDLTYNLRSRSPLPAEISQAGYTTIAIRGRGKYGLVKGEDRVQVPAGTEIADIPTRSIPTAVRDILRADEQSILSAIRYLDLVSDFMGTNAFHLQGHLRTTGSFGQQVEADDVWIARYPNKSRAVLPIEAKGPKERLGRHQMMSTIDAVRRKIPGFLVIPLAVQLEQSGSLVLVEFGYQSAGENITKITPTRFKRYRLIPKLPLWP